MSEKGDVKDPAIPVGDVGAVSIRCPQFSENNPNNWFRALEAQFTLKGITVSSTRYLHALSNLPTEVLDSLPDEILDSNDYRQLKEAVNGFYTKTKAELFERLISTTPMVGRPSAYLRTLQQIASKVGGNEDLVRHKFMQSLPPVIATALASQRSLSLTEIGSMADELSPLVNQAQVNQVTPPPQQNSYQYQYNRQASSYNQRSQTPRHQQQGIPIGLRPFNSSQRPKICRAHLYFAERARTCKPWCKFPRKSGCSILPSSRASSPARSTTSEN